MAKTKLIPGFRFHPTGVELVKYFLKRKVMGRKFYGDVIAELDIYKYAPWDLPDKSYLRTGDLEWYFFCAREKKYGSGVRMNRATDIGYWKTTGKDRTIQQNNETVGMIKTLIFHIGKAPQGERTNWVMHEYRLEDKELAGKGIAQDSYVICKVFQKEGVGPRNGAQYGKPFSEEDWDDEEVGIPFASLSASSPILPMTHDSFVPNDKHLPAGGYVGSTSTCISGSMVSLGPINPSHLAMTSDSSAPNDIHLPDNGYIVSTSTSCLSGSMLSPGPTNPSQLAMTYDRSVPNDRHLPDSGYIGSTSTSCLSGSMLSPGPTNPSQLAMTYDRSVPNDKHLPDSGYIGSTSTSCLSGSTLSPGPTNPSHQSITSESYVPNDEQLPVSDQAVNKDENILSMLDLFKEDEALPKEVDNPGKENIAEGEGPSTDFFEGLGDPDYWAAFDGFNSEMNAEITTNGMATSDFGDLEFIELIDLDSPVFWQTTTTRHP